MSELKTDSSPDSTETKPIVAYKGFDAQMQCRSYQYEVGKTYEHEGTVQACEEGFHSCENPLDVFAYYPPTEGNLFAEVEASGQISRHGDDTKIASGRLHVKLALSLPDFIGRALEWLKANCVLDTSNHATGDRSASSATGDSSASSATGYRSASSATGDRSASSATGYRSASSATGYSSASLTTGYEGKSQILRHAENESLKAVAIATGEKGKVRAPMGCAIVLVERSESDGSILHIRATKVGENGVKPDVWYSLQNGEFVKVES